MPLTDKSLRHIAVIMDGNGRWAKKNNLPTIAGHKAGAEATRRITEAAFEYGVEYLTLYAFSSENWRRDQHWINELFGLLSWYLEHEITYLNEKNVRLRSIGDRERLPEKIRKLLNNAETKTKNNTGITILLALSYSGRDEIVRAANALIKDAKAGVIDNVTEQTFSAYLDTRDIPDPDLLIRTSGEQRLSNFLLWQLAYAEFVFDDIFWPDFTKEHFEKALYEFKNRERRYGRDVT